jgi:transposase
LSKHFTKDFEAFALMREMPVSKVSEIVQVSDGWRMLLAHVDAAYDKLNMETVVGADEMNRRKGHRYLTVFCDLEARRLLFATPGKDAQVWDRFAGVLQEHGGELHQVSQISIDMIPAYRQGVAWNFGKAEVVFDKFHVIGHAGIAVDAVRRLETRWLWLKNPDNLTIHQQLNRIDQDSLWTAKAYQMRLALQGIYLLPRQAPSARLVPLGSPRRFESSGAIAVANGQGRAND